MPRSANKPRSSSSRSSGAETKKWAIPAAAAAGVLALGGAAGVDAYYNNGKAVDTYQTVVRNGGVLTPPEKAAAAPQTTPTDIPVILLDPGHGGTTDKSRVDPVTNLGDRYNPNGPEQIEDWAVAVRAQAKLKALGYVVHLSKESANQGMFLRERVDKAEAVGADLAVSIHTDHGQPFSWGRIFEQRVGGCRGSEPKVCFTNENTAALSQTYAVAMQKSRTAAEGRPVEITVNSFDGRAPIEPGDIPMVQLFSDIPWVYHEIGANDGLNEAEQEMYATGLVNGIVAALPIRAPVAAG